MLKDKWYLICPAKELKAGKIRKLRILDEDIVVFRDAEGRPSAIEDRCCHRNVPLSLGEMKRGCVVCPYHGWTFDGGGQCVHIPSLAAEDKIPRSARVRRYVVREQHKLLWVFVGEEEKVGQCEPPPIPEMDIWPFVAREHIFEADLEAAAESLLDPYHIAFTHSQSIGTLLGSIEELPQNPDFHIDVVKDGLIGHYMRENTSSFFEKQYFGTDPQIQINYRFYYPNLSRLEITFHDRVLLILEHIMQVDETHVSMTQITLWKNIFKPFPWFAKFFMRRKSDKIVGEDIALLQAQRKIMEQMKNKEGRVREVSVRGDAISLAFRKYWRAKLKGDAFVGDEAFEGSEEAEDVELEEDGRALGATASMDV
ncbi:MAG: aromatic ring-hydroxylating dioxygenase subunit alpha [Myxococcales bacterium]|nr:aromatic ring-hydroxylating dioxygenase subunit alpha [Myxococcales bacterium]